MRLIVSVTFVASCWSAPAPTTPSHRAPATTIETLPCGLARPEDFESVPLSSAIWGTCRVEARGDYREVFEGDRRVLVGGEAKPAIALDRRIPGPHGIRVGMTGTQIARVIPTHRWHRCNAHANVLYCELRRSSAPTICESELGSDAAEPITVGFPASDLDAGAELTSGIASVVAGRRATHVILVQPC